MLGVKHGGRMDKRVPYYVVFDLETTGISVTYDDIIEISAVKVENGRVIDEFSTLVNPGRPIPSSATIVNGISNNMVGDAPTFQEVLPLFLKFIGDYVLVGHNIQAFDLKFIYREIDHYFPGQTLDNDYVDTLKMAKKILPSMEKHRLTDLAMHYNISAEGAHRALNDCRMNQKVYEFLCDDINNPRADDPKVKLCPKCGSQMVKRQGRYGLFWGCREFPRCRYTENLE